MGHISTDPEAFIKSDFMNRKLLILKKPKSSTSPVEFLTFSTGSTITVTCVTKQSSKCEWQQSQQFLWPDT